MHILSPRNSKFCNYSGNLCLCWVHEKHSIEARLYLWHMKTTVRFQAIIWWIEESRTIFSECLSTHSGIKVCNKFAKRENTEKKRHGIHERHRLQKQYGRVLCMCANYFHASIFRIHSQILSLYARYLARSLAFPLCILLYSFVFSLFNGWGIKLRTKIINKIRKPEFGFYVHPSELTISWSLWCFSHMI